MRWTGFVGRTGWRMCSALGAWRSGWGRRLGRRSRIWCTVGWERVLVEILGRRGVWSLVEGMRGVVMLGAEGRARCEIVIRGEDMIEGSEKFENREASRGIVDGYNINFNSYIVTKLGIMGL